MSSAYLGLGSNKGERINYIKNAFNEIEKISGTCVIKCSSIYETQPWGILTQNDYLNSAIKIETNLSAEDLLKELKGIEIKLGRQENLKWSEREIDIDLLFYENEIISKENMKVPHPQIENRKFVLIPLNEIAPSLIHPVLKKSMSELLKETEDKLSVRKYQKDNADNFHLN